MAKQGMALAAFAFDRSARYYDADGRLHVTISNISKANVCPYRGLEIPDYQTLGLDPDRVYQLLRDPAELEKAAATFNNLPLLIRHVPVTVDAPSRELVVGSTGTDAAFTDPYLTNSLVIWTAEAIAGVETQEQQELSAAYRYVADMTPGTYKGLRYDGIMRNIRGNHLALVEAGRAGSDVVVQDSRLKGPMMKIRSRSALMLQGALVAHVLPKLAQDAALDLTPLLGGVTAKNYGKSTKGLADKVVRLVTPMVAQDGDVAVKDVTAIIEALTPGAGAEDEDDMMPEPATAEDEDDDTKDKPPVAEDEDDDDTKDKKDPPAMDAAFARRLADNARTGAVADMRALMQAQRDVRPFVGEVDILAMDSADAVYKMALDAAKVDLTGVPASAYSHMVKLLPAPDAKTTAKPALAMDAAADAKLVADYPNIRRLKTI